MVINPATIKLNKLSLACRDLTLKDVVEYSEKKQCGRIWMFFKLLISGKGMASTDSIAMFAHIYFQENQENVQLRALLDQHPHLRNFLRIHYFAIKQLGNEENKPEGLKDPHNNPLNELGNEVKKNEEVEQVARNILNEPAREEEKDEEINQLPNNQPGIAPAIAKEEFIRMYRGELMNKMIQQIETTTSLASIEKALVLINVDCNQQIKKDKIFQGMEIGNVAIFQESLENIFQQIAEQVADNVSNVNWSIFFKEKNSNTFSFADGSATEEKTDTHSKWSSSESAGTFGSEGVKGGFELTIRSMGREDKLQEWEREFNL